MLESASNPQASNPCPAVAALASLIDVVSASLPQPPLAVEESLAPLYLLRTNRALFLNASMVPSFVASPGFYQNLSGTTTVVYTTTHMLIVYVII